MKLIKEIKKLDNEVETLEIPADIKNMPPLQQLAIYWKVIVIILGFVKIFTNEKADVKINQIIDWGNQNL